MQSERAREAAEFRAKGSETAQTITATADRDVVVLRGNPQRQADQTRGEGDVERNRIFAEAYGKDPDFFAFYRSMQAYETGLKGGDTRMVLSPSAFAHPMVSRQRPPGCAVRSPLAHVRINRAMLGDFVFVTIGAAAFAATALYLHACASL